MADKTATNQERMQNTMRLRSSLNNISKRGDGIMYRITPINRNKVLQGLQNLKFDDVESYRTHVFEKHSIMNDKENLNMVLQGNKKTQSCFIADPDRPEDTNGNVEYAKKVISNAIMGD